MRFYLNYEELKRIEILLKRKSLSRFYLNYKELKPNFRDTAKELHISFYLNYEELKHFTLTVFSDFSTTC